MSNQFNICLVLTFVDIRFPYVVLHFRNFQYCGKHMTHTERSMLYTHTYARNSMWKRLRDMTVCDSAWSCDIVENIRRKKDSIEEIKNWSETRCSCGSDKFLAELKCARHVRPLTSAIWDAVSQNFLRRLLYFILSNQCSYESDRSFEEDSPLKFRWILNQLWASESEYESMRMEMNCKDVENRRA